MKRTDYKILAERYAFVRRKIVWAAFTQLVEGLGWISGLDGELPRAWGMDTMERIDSFDDCWDNFSKLTSDRFEELKTLCDDILDGLELFDLYRFDDLDPDYRATDKYFKRGVISQIKRELYYQGLNRKLKENARSILTAEQLKLF